MTLEEKQSIINRLKKQILIANRKCNAGDKGFSHERDYLTGMIMVLSSIGVSVDISIGDESVPIFVRKARILFPADTDYITFYNFDEN